MPLLIVIPVRNEERRLGPGLARLAESLQAHHCPDALIVVSDNGSTDWTRPAERAPDSRRHSTGESVYPTR